MSLFAYHLDISSAILLSVIPQFLADPLGPLRIFSVAWSRRGPSVLEYATDRGPRSGAAHVGLDDLRPYRLYYMVECPGQSAWG